MVSSKEIRIRLRNGEPVLGTWLQLPCPDVAEIIARLGYTWAAVDLEHGAFSRNMLPDMFRSLERWGVLPFARLPEASMTEIKAALDSGAQGLVFPMIESRSQLDAAIEWSLYPSVIFPKGKRGVGFCRGNLFGMDFTGHVDPVTGSEHDVVLVAQIEHIHALPHLDEIFSHPRLDAYMVGPYDLSASMGLTGQFEHPDFKRALECIEKKAEAYSLPKGFHVVAPEEKVLEQKIREGYTFLAYGIDALFLQSAGKCPRVRQ